jgi:hypothetical protein
MRHSRAAPRHRAAQARTLGHDRYGTAKALRLRFSNGKEQPASSTALFTVGSGRGCHPYALTARRPRLRCLISANFLSCADFASSSAPSITAFAAAKVLARAVVSSPSGRDPSSIRSVSSAPAIPSTSSILTAARRALQALFTDVSQSVALLILTADPSSLICRSQGKNQSEAYSQPPGTEVILCRQGSEPIDFACDPFPAHTDLAQETLDLIDFVRVITQIGFEQGASHVVVESVEC